MTSAPRDALGRFTSDLPRYCTCVAYQRTPGLPEQCDRCYRRIHPRYDHRIGDEKTP